ncbi:sensor histidine kinase [Paenibacillus selenitireducens]|uniref:sensor histidine kinase n=1 Tax=Paenibacillus selenitireducens TaxID=1324314 RepID=UPI001E2C5DE3|nr:HAMP domain-containing sensor histidine kinase [Paenibacillus selenitireducens]
MKWLKCTKIGVGILLFIGVSTIIWSVAFIITSYVYDHRNKTEVWEGMFDRGTQIAQVLHYVADDHRREVLEQLSGMDQFRILLTQRSGNGLDGELYGGGIPAYLREQVGESEVARILKGEKLTFFQRPHLLSEGYLTTGQQVTIRGTTYALLLQQATPSLFHDYGRQLVTILVDLVLLFFIGLLMRVRGEPQQFIIMRSIIDALRRIAKGDFSVNLDINRNFRGFGILAESVNSMAVELGQMEQMRQEFISNVSHEIQSPLHSISGFARAMHNDALTKEERTHYLDIIETESRRLSKLSDNLLKLTSLESSSYPFETKRYRLDRQLRNLVLALEPHWLGKSIEIDITLEETFIVADEDGLSQVWVNLISNAIKFTPVGGTIGIDLRQHDQQAIITVKDDGIGIADEDQAHIFERFYKADKARNRALGGSGLGLSIVKKILDMHHGEIAVHSRVGEGSTFVVLLPLVPTALDQQQRQGSPRG